MNFSFDQTEHIGILSFKGSLTENYAMKLREVLMSSWGKTPTLIISLESVTEVDRSCLQIFCTAYRVSLMTKKSFTMIGIPVDKVKSTALNWSLCSSYNQGGVPIPGISQECSSNCLWTYKGGY